MIRSQRLARAMEMRFQRLNAQLCYWRLSGTSRSLQSPRSASAEASLSYRNNESWSLNGLNMACILTTASVLLAKLMLHLLGSESARFDIGDYYD